MTREAQPDLPLRVLTIVSLGPIREVLPGTRGWQRHQGSPLGTPRRRVSSSIQPSFWRHSKPALRLRVVQEESAADQHRMSPADTWRNAGGR